MSDESKILTEGMLDVHYADKGMVFKTELQAREFLQKRGYTQLKKIFKNKHGQVARIYALRDAILDPSYGGVRGYVNKGFLASFGGNNPVSCVNLKYTRIQRGVWS